MKQEGWFSRRHKTAEAHKAAQAAREERVSSQVATMLQNTAERAARSNREQLAVLDARLGPGQGARKERARLRRRRRRRR